MGMLSIQDFMGFHDDRFVEHYGEDLAGRVPDDVRKAMVERDVIGCLSAAGQGAAGISKALTSDSNVAVAGTVGGEALKIQDLTQTLAVAELNSKEHAPLWNYLKQVPCDSDVVEMTQLNTYGRQRRGGYLRTNVSNGGLVARDPDLERKTTPVRWTGERWQTFTTANALRAVNFKSDPVTGGADQVNSTAAMESLILSNNALAWWGDHAVNRYEPNGVIAQTRLAHDDGNYRTVTRVNMAGQPITTDTLPQITKILRAKGATWTDFWFSNQVECDLEILMQDIIRDAPGKGVTWGIIPVENKIKTFGGQLGTSQFRMDIMLDPEHPDDTFTADATAPTAPTTVTGAQNTTTATPTGGSATVPLNVWKTYLAAATYTYSVCAVNTNGRSAVTVISSPVSANGTTQQIVLTITNGADTSGDNAADYFEVYRAVSGGTRKFLGRCSAYGIANGATATFVDNGEFYPGCSTAFAMANKPHGNGGSTWMTRMLHPITKVILPPDVIANQAAYICGWTPQGLTITHNIVVENVGTLATS